MLTSIFLKIMNISSDLTLKYDDIVMLKYSTIKAEKTFDCSYCKLYINVTLVTGELPKYSRFRTFLCFNIGFHIISIECAKFTEHFFHVIFVWIYPFNVQVIVSVYNKVTEWRTRHH